MNTVLDDNKKLCLTSGEIIKLTPYMSMIFEAEMLNEASPATVSRCGMIYMEEEDCLNYQSLIHTWILLHMPCSFNTPNYRELFMTYFDYFLPLVLDWMSQQTGLPIATSMN
jgi:dynein heavy chain